MTTFTTKLACFSFGDRGTNASEYTLPNDNLTAILEVNISDTEFAELSGIQIPDNAEENTKKALGVETGQILPKTYESVAIRFALPSGATLWFPNCTRHTAKTIVRFMAYVYTEPDGRKWFAEIDGKKFDADNGLGQLRLEDLFAGVDPVQEG